MESHIYGILPKPYNYRPVDIFGYCTKSMPGVEINGMGKLGRQIKEKFIYLSRARKLKIPSKRFVMCVSDAFDFQDIRPADLQWLELPLLTLFWTLSEQLPLKCKGEIIASGKVCVTGAVYHQSFEEIAISGMEGIGREHRALKYIYPVNLNLGEGNYQIDSIELFKVIPDFNIYGP